MTLLYITQDKIGTETGGGLVTAQERLALQELDDVRTITPDHSLPAPDPFTSDREVLRRLKQELMGCRRFPRLAHCYAGCLGETVRFLKENGCKVSFTVAAHDRAVSKREHEALGVPFNYPHLVEEPLWQRYIEGYRLADVIVCPGTVPAKTVREYGSDFERKQIEVIPHGCHLPDTVVPLPKTFTVGYLGSYGPDKGVKYLFQAWKKLALKDAVLMLGGQDSTHPWVRQLWKDHGGGNVCVCGWQENVSDFYNQLSVYVQPSATEGFGIEVLEAMAHGRPVVCSAGAGAMDLLPKNPFGPFKHAHVVRPCDVNELVTAIADFQCYRMDDNDDVPNPMWREIAEQYTWNKIRQKYIDMWKGML